MNARNSSDLSESSSDHPSPDVHHSTVRALAIALFLAVAGTGCGDGGGGGAYFDLDFTTTLRVANWQEEPVSSFAIRHTADTEWTVYDLVPPLERGERLYLGDVAAGQVTFAAEACDGSKWPCEQGETFDLNFSRDYTLQLHDKGVLHLIWKERD